nr:hypothetical protein [Micromonospora purpureochromogenes]
MPYSSGGLLADAEFPATSDGYADLLAWMRGLCGPLPVLGGDRPVADLFRKTSGKSLTCSKRRCNTPKTVTLISVD